MDRAVVFDVNFCTGLRDDALDRFATGSDERADFLRINFQRLDARRVLAQLLARLGERFGHEAEDLRPRILGAMDGFRQDFVAHTRKFQIELKTRDTVLGPAKFEIHVSEMILGADDVGQQIVAFQVPLLVILRHETDRNTRRPAF